MTGSEWVDRLLDGARQERNGQRGMGLAIGSFKGESVNQCVRDAPVSPVSGETGLVGRQPLR